MSNRRAIKGQLKMWPNTNGTFSKTSVFFLLAPPAVCLNRYLYGIQNPTLGVASSLLRGIHLHRRSFLTPPAAEHARCPPVHHVQRTCVSRPNPVVRFLGVLSSNLFVFASWRSASPSPAGRWKPVPFSLNYKNSCDSSSFFCDSRTGCFGMSLSFVGVGYY